MNAGGHARSSARGALRRAAPLCLVLLALLAISGLGASGVAFGAETTVTFDELPAGLLTNQDAGQGIEFGEAQSFKQSLAHGDCGGPTVHTDAVVAHSGSNYAQLAQCGVGATFSGTYGALLNTPRGSLSVYVKDIVPGGTAPKVALIGYDATGKEVAKGQAAVTGEWALLTATQAGGANVQISYFSIATTAPNNDSIAIDDMSFEAPGGGKSGGEEGGGTTTTSGTAPPVPPPTSAISLQTPNPGPGQALTLSGAGSQPGTGRIISYDWDLNGDGKIDTSTGASSTVHVILAPGVHTIGLTVTNSGGQNSSSKFGVTIGSVASAIPPPDGGQGPCVPTLEEGFARIVAECIQKLPGGGYVIETKQLELNGMVLSPQAGGFGIFKVQTVKDIAIAGTQTLLSGSSVNVELLNTPLGDVVLGSRDLESEPMQLTAHSGLSSLKIPINHGFRAPRARAAGEATSKTLLMAFGVGRECPAKESKKAGCCPPAHENTACATLPGNFPLTGQVVVYLTNKGQALLDVQVGLTLKGIFEATGALEIEADPETGINLNSLKFTVPEAGLEGIFTVKKASFAYYFPSAPEESKRDTWQAEGTIVFGPLGEPSLEAELAFKKGQFHSASLVFVAPPPGIPIYPGVALNKLGGSIGVEPFSFGGTLGASVATQLELTLSFKYREASGTELGFFGGQGQLELDDDKIATLAADVYSDGYIDAQLNIDLHIPFSSENPIVKVGGNIGFWDEPASGLWQAEGNVYVKLWEISAEAAALVNNQYIAGCLDVASFGVQGRYRFSDGNIDGGLFGFSNCSDQLKQYKQTPLVTHSGGFVGGEALRFPRRGHAGWSGIPAPADALTAAAQGAADTFTLPSGQLGQELRLTSTTGTPVVTLIAPGGQTYTTPAAPGQIVSVPGQFIAAVAPNHNQVLVLLKHPGGGTWRVQSAAGSPPLQKLEVAADAPPATVRVKVKHAHGSRWSLRYAIAHYVPGTKVRFVERGRDSTHVLGTASRATGTLRFTPQDAISRARKIVAYVLNAEGMPVRELTVGRYSAPAAARAGRVGRVRIVRRGLTARVSWGAAPGARGYTITVRGSDGRLETLSATARHRSLVLANVLPFESFTVTVKGRGGPNLLAGPSATGMLAAVKVRRHASRKHVSKG